MSTTSVEPARSVDVVRKARRAPRRHHAFVVIALAVILFGAFVARVLLGNLIITVPDFFRILGGAVIPGATFL
ncbi:MAG: iron ABC transporter permease, partial [Nocardioidaceae bacterium]